MFAGRTDWESLCSDAAKRLFHAGRKHRLEMRTLLFPGYHAHINILEPRVLQELVQLHFAEPEPVIGVQFPRSLKGMAQQIQDHDAPVLSQTGVGALDCAFRLRRMMQRLTENREIDAILCNRWLL